MLSAKAPTAPRVLVIGAGRSGRAAVDLVHRLGGSSLLLDDSPRPTEGLPESCTPLDPDRAEGALSDCELVVPSPGVPATHRMLVAASAAGVAVASEVEFASRHLDAPILAVTGTNGKSTTVSVLAAALASAGKRVFAGGNLGRPLCEAVGGGFEVCAVEVSSFQLEWVDTFRPRAAAMLNIAPDHLDRHGDLAGYTAAKMRLFEKMTADSLAVIGPGLGAQAVYLRERGLRVVLMGAELRIDTVSRRISVAGRTVQLGGGWPRAGFDFENVAAASALALDYGVEPEAVTEAVSNFLPLAHRLSRVAVHRGVEFWNDSKATNPAAAVSSVQALAGPVILLAGGRAKGALDELESVADKVKAVVAFGEAADQVGRVFSAAACVKRAAGMGTACEIALSLASPGDQVLLAPGCASFDEFADYADRGAKFIAWVEGLRGRA